MIYISIVKSNTGITPATYTAKPQGHWTKANMRKLLEKFAHSRKLDPLRAETWYNTPEKAIRHAKVFSVFYFYYYILFLFIRSHFSDFFNIQRIF